MEAGYRELSDSERRSQMVKQRFNWGRYHCKESEEMQIEGVEKEL